MENIKKARMQQKHDVATNWNNIEEFVPKPGEIIVYDKDENTLKQSIKVGDGETPVGELGFITGEIYTSKKEPKNAGEGAVWITLDDNTPADLPEDSGSSSVNSNWGVNNEGQEGFVRNRPLWNKQASVSIPWNENAEIIQIEDINAHYVSNLTLRLSEMADLSVYIANDTIPYGNITAPELPSYDAINYPYYVLSYSYQVNQKDWSYIDFFYSNEPFTYNGTTKNIVNDGDIYKRRVAFGSTSWGTAEKINSNIAFTPGLSEASNTYIRFYSSHDIVNENYTVILNAYYFSTVDYGSQWAFKGYISTQNELKELLVAENAGKEEFYLVNGAVYGYASNSYFIITIVNDGEVKAYFLGYIVGKNANEDLPSGIYYFVNGTDNSFNYICRMDLTYSTVKVNEIYQRVFKDADASNVYILDETALANFASNPLVLESELMRFSAGDILLLPTALIEMVGG